MLSRAGAWSGEVSESDGATGQAVPDLRISTPSVVARILVWARDGTDFGPSINGVGSACASRHTVCESERWRDGAGCYRTSAFRRTHHSKRLTRALTDCNSQLFTLTRPFGRRFGVPRRQDSDACMCARATRHAMQAPDRARPLGASNLDPWHRGARRPLEGWFRNGTSDECSPSDSYPRELVEKDESSELPPHPGIRV